MGAANTKLALSLNPNAVSCEAYWYPNGTSAISTIRGNGVHSVSRTATGAYTVTLKQPWRHIVNADLKLVHPTSTSGRFHTLGHFDGYRGVSGSAYITVQHQVAGVGADISASTQAFVSMVITLCDSKVIEGTA
jgi:hypothetical protein